jgi:KDO2-lipid IV(A) lauroyltransferase
VRIYPPVEFSPTGDQERDVLALTVKITQVMEALVREHPSQWLWIHRRWPKPLPQALGGAAVSVASDGSSLS